MAQLPSLRRALVQSGAPRDTLDRMDEFALTRDGVWLPLPASNAQSPQLRAPPAISAGSARSPAKNAAEAVVARPMLLVSGGGARAESFEPLVLRNRLFALSQCVNLGESRQYRMALGLRRGWCGSQKRVGACASRVRTKLLCARTCSNSSCLTLR